MKRGCVFVYSKRTNSVEDYIFYLIDSIKKFVNYLIIVCDENETEKVKEDLDNYADFLMTENNVTTGVECYWKGIHELLSGEQRYDFDELFLINDDIYGPIFPFDHMLQKMSDEQFDIWGIVKQPEYYGHSREYYPSSISREFMCVNKSLFLKADFIDFWLNNVEDSSDKKEQWNCFRYFDDLGYSIGGYISDETFDSSDVSRNYNYYEFLSYDMLSKLECPVLFRKSFLLDTNMNDALNKALDFIDRNSDYRLDMILQDILQTMNLADLRRTLNLNYIVSSRKACTVKISRDIYKKSAVIAHIFYSERVDICLGYLFGIAEDIDIYISTSNEKTYGLLEKKVKSIGRKNIVISLIPNRGRDMSALWVANRYVLEKYEYVCFVHDKKTSGSIGNTMSGELYQYDAWENCLANKCYVDNVLSLFENNKKIGFLCPPFPKFFDYLNLMGNEWTECFEVTKNLANELQLNVDISDTKQPFTFSNTFWCKTNALRPLIERKFRYDDFPPEPLPRDGTISHAIERIYAYVAQSEGYFSVVIENESYAEMELISMQNLLSERIQWNIAENKMREKLEKDDKILRDYIASLENTEHILREYSGSLEEIRAHMEEDKKKLEEEVNSLKNDQERLTAEKQYLEKRLLESDNLNQYENREYSLLKRFYNILIFSLPLKKIYIFGTGKIADMVSVKLKDAAIAYEGFIISDDQEKPEELNGHICYHYSDVTIKENEGVIVALNKKNTQEVRPLLNSVKNVFYFSEEE